MLLLTHRCVETDRVPPNAPAPGMQAAIPPDERRAVLAPPVRRRDRRAGDRRTLANAASATFVAQLMSQQGSDTAEAVATGFAHAAYQHGDALDRTGELEPIELLTVI